MAKTIEKQKKLIPKPGKQVKKAQSIRVSSISKKKDGVTTVESKQETTSLRIPDFDAVTKKEATTALSKEIFGQNINTQLIMQAVLVYQEHLRRYTASVKTRGEVEGSKKKIYKQKGTGRARHGGKRAPIFVHGGIAHGPQVKTSKLSLPKKMRRAALISALSNQYNEHILHAVSNLTKVEAKSRSVHDVLNAMSIPVNTLVIVGPNMENHVRALRNIDSIEVLRAKDINAFEIMKHKRIVFTKEGISELEHVLLSHK